MINIMNINFLKNFFYNNTYLLYILVNDIIVLTLGILSLQHSFIDYYTSFGENKIIEKNNILQCISISLWCSYYIIDTIYMIKKKNYLMIAHHLITIYVQSISLYYFSKNINIVYYYTNAIILFVFSNLYFYSLKIVKQFILNRKIINILMIINTIIFILCRFIFYPIILFLFYYNEQFTTLQQLQLPAFLLILGGIYYNIYRQIIGIINHKKKQDYILLSIRNQLAIQNNINNINNI